MRNLFRLFVPLIINPYYYIKKIKKKNINNFFEYQQTPYDRTSLILSAICKILSKKKIEDLNYLEIGVFDNRVFNTIPLDINQKVGVDPNRGGTHRMTSDEFFNKNDKKFDVIFIDGLHTYKQCQNDCLNAISSLKDGGFIIFHDMLPRSAQEEESVASGDVWKVAVELSISENLNFVIANIDQGVGLLTTTKDTVYKKQNDLVNKNFKDYKDNYYKTLPIVDINSAFNFIKSN